MAFYSQGGSVQPRNVADSLAEQSQTILNDLLCFLWNYRTTFNAHHLKLVVDRCFTAQEIIEAETILKRLSLHDDISSFSVESSADVASETVVDLLLKLPDTIAHIFATANLKSLSLKLRLPVGSVDQYQCDNDILFKILGEIQELRDVIRDRLGENQKLCVDGCTSPLPEQRDSSHPNDIIMAQSKNVCLSPEPSSIVAQNQPKLPKVDAVGAQLQSPKGSASVNSWLPSSTLVNGSLENVVNNLKRNKVDRGGRLVVNTSGASLTAATTEVSSNKKLPDKQPTCADSGLFGNLHGGFGTSVASLTSPHPQMFSPSPLLNGGMACPLGGFFPASDIQMEQVLQWYKAYSYFVMNSLTQNGAPLSQKLQPPPTLNFNQFSQNIVPIAVNTGMGVCGAPFASPNLQVFHGNKGSGGDSGASVYKTSPTGGAATTGAHDLSQHYDGASGGGGNATNSSLDLSPTTSSSVKSPNSAKQQRLFGEETGSSGRGGAHSEVSEDDISCGGDSPIDEFTPSPPEDRSLRMIHSRNSQLLHDAIDKPYVCTYKNCNKRFANKFLLKKHEFIHTGERPHQCPYCGKRFNRKDNLLRHKKTHLANGFGGAKRRHVLVFGVKNDAAPQPQRAASPSRAVSTNPPDRSLDLSARSFLMGDLSTAFATNGGGTNENGGSSGPTGLCCP